MLTASSPLRLATFAWLILMLLAGALSLPSPARAATGPANLWIDTNGGTCTRGATPAAYADASACSSIQAAVAASSNGDTIRIKAGSYGAQTITTSKTSTTYVIADDGTSIGSFSPRGNYIEYQNFTAANMDLEDVDAQHVTLRNVSVASQGHVTIDGPDHFAWIGGTLGSYVIDHGDWPGRVMIQGSPGATTDVLLDGLVVQPVTRTAAAVSAGDHTEVIRFNQGVNGATLRNMTFQPGSNINSAVIFIGGAGAGTTETNLTFENNFFGQATDAQPLIDSNGQGAACTTWLISYNTNATSNNLFAGGSTNCTSQANITLRGNLGKLNGANSCGNAVYDNNVWTNSAGCGGGDLANQRISFTGDGFHIPSTSPAVGNGAATCPATDHDGEVRSGACDAGADQAGSGGTVDSTAPDTTLTSAPSGSTTSTSASMAFTADEAASTFQCRIDGGTWATCSSPASYSGLAVGAHSFDVRAIDLSGNIDATPATASWTVTAPVDTTPPNTSITSAPSGSTTSTSASLAFSATEAVTFECRMDAGAWTSCASPKSYSGLTIGSHTFDVRATDLAGNTDLTPASAAWTVVAPADTTPPDTSIVSGPSGSTTSTSAALAFSATETATFECRLDSGAWAPCTSPKSYSSLAIGAHTFSVRATDASGNTDLTPASRAWTVTAPADTTAPDTAITSGPSGSGTDTSAAIAFTATEAGSTFECRLDGGTWAACTSPKSYSGVAVGSHTFDVRATDAAGNTDASPASRSWTVVAPVDTTPPDTTITSGPAASTTATSASVAFTATETGSTFECRLDSGAWAACSSPEGEAGLAVGAHRIDVRATDAAGNVDATPANWSWTVVAPAPPPPAPDTTAPDTNLTSGPTTVTTQRSATFEFTATESPATFGCSLDGGRWNACTSPKSYSSLSRGKHTIRVRATDAAGNTDATPVSYTWSIVRRTYGTTYSFEPLSGRSSTPVQAESLEGACALVSNPRARLGVRLGGLKVRRGQRVLRISGKVPELAQDGVNARVRVSVRSHGHWRLLVSRRVHVRFDGSFRVKAPRRDGKLKVTAIARCG